MSHHLTAIAVVIILAILVGAGARWGHRNQPRISVERLAGPRPRRTCTVCGWPVRIGRRHLHCVLLYPDPPADTLRDAMLEAQLRHDLNDAAERIYAGDQPKCGNCRVVFNNDADRSEVLPCADCQPDQLPQRTGKHRRIQFQAEDGTVMASITDYRGKPLDDQPTHVIQAQADKLRRQP